jgi:hypothetical protein
MRFEHPRSSLVLFLAFIAGLCLGAVMTVNAASGAGQPHLRQEARTEATQP